MRSRSPPAPVRSSPGSLAGPCPPPGPPRSAWNPPARPRSEGSGPLPDPRGPPRQRLRSRCAQRGRAPPAPGAGSCHRAGKGGGEGGGEKRRGRRVREAPPPSPYRVPGSGAGGGDSPAVRCWRPVPRCAPTAAAPRLSPALWSLARKSPVRGGRPPIGRRWRELSAGGGATPNRERGRAPQRNRDPSRDPPTHTPGGRARSGPFGPVPSRCEGSERVQWEPPVVRGKGPPVAPVPEGPLGCLETAPGTPGRWWVCETSGRREMSPRGCPPCSHLPKAQRHRRARHGARLRRELKASPGAQNLTGSSKPHRELQTLPGAQGPAVVLREASKIRAASCRAPGPCAWSPRKRGRGRCCGTESRAGPGGCFPLHL